MPYFRLKEPGAVEARQFDGEPSRALEGWLGPAFVSWVPSHRELVVQAWGRYEDVACEIALEPGDWLIRLLDGVFDTASDADFRRDYEPADPPVRVYVGDEEVPRA